ncbi:hypothetical protein RHMOL_Rhmol10G0215900 [Rhododendron molle]|uniref:Uncharacterized protein n=1 Tax=Rhododendron molle TaxID=49168 RepID=A0ACC0M5V3_RHOML|nr:hypothetical protein RHMOL_Rhmol10G0215900 [Rhododendron molle]
MSMIVAASMIFLNCFAQRLSLQETISVHRYKKMLLGRQGPHLKRRKSMIPAEADGQKWKMTLKWAMF